LAEKIPITTASTYASDERLTDEQIRYIFRSETEEQIPLLQQRITLMREAGRVLVEVKDNVCQKRLLQYAIYVFCRPKHTEIWWNIRQLRA